MNSTERTQQHLYEITIEHRLCRLELTDEAILKSLEKIESKLDKITTEIKQEMKQGFDKIDSKIEKLDSRIWTNFYWILTTILSLSTILAGLMVKGFHWY